MASSGGDRRRKQPGKAHCAEETGDDERLCSDGKKTTALGEEEEGSNW